MITALICGGLTAITGPAFHVCSRVLAREDMPLTLVRGMAVSW